MFESKRLKVRRFVPEDAPALHRILSSEKVMEFIEDPFDLPKTRSFIAEFGSGPQPDVYAILLKDKELAAHDVLRREEEEPLIGQLIYHHFDRSDCWEVGWLLAETYWGRGLATEVTEALIGYARRKGVESLVIESVPENPGPQRIAEKLGFCAGGEDDGLVLFFKDL